MATVKMYGSYRNGGDGSVYVVWFDTEALAQWDQEHLDEGWGEPCILPIVIDGYDIVHNLDVQTLVTYYASTVIGLSNEEIEEFIEDFFPIGQPSYTVEIEEEYGFKSYVIYHKDVKVAKAWAYPEATEEGRLKVLNSLNVGHHVDDPETV